MRTLKTSIVFPTRRLLWPGFLMIALGALWLFAAPAVHARTITLNLEFGRLQFSAIDPNYQGQTYWTANVSVSSDVPPVTYDEVLSPIPAYSGSENGGGRSFFFDMASALNPMTNGAWTLTVNKGDVSEKHYTFTVSASGLGNNIFPAVQITTPADANLAVATNTPFSWSGPAAWDELDLVDRNLDYSFYAPDSQSPATTSWINAPLLPLGTNEFEVTYKTNGAAWFTISTPVDNLSHPFTNWVSGIKLIATAQSGFVTTTNPAVPPSAVGPRHTLIAHYAFDDSGNHGADSSGNFNDINCGSGWGPGEVFSTNALAGAGALQFFGGSSITPCNESFTSWTNALAGSFTVSAWIKTTNVVGNDADALDDFHGQSIVYADNNNLGATPVALTGGKVAFRTTDPHGHDDTLHSVQSVTTGNYVHIVSTRDQITGEKKIYINGALDSSDVASTEFLSGAQYVSIGGELFSPYHGLVDDVQIYSGVLSSNDVTYLYNNHGQTVSNLFGPGGLAAHYDFDENTVLAPDVSGNDNNIIRSGNFGGGSDPTISATHKAGVGSMSFHGSLDDGNGSYLTAQSSLLPTLAGSFTISLWVNTTQDNNNPNDYAFTGVGIISADVGGLANDLVPVALTGGQVAFNTGSPAGGDDTINSSATVNDGTWHHVVVSRNQTTGEKDIYIDGILDTSDFNTTNLLNDPQLLTIGAIADAGNSDPTSPGYNGYNGYNGLLDDIQIYGRVLSSNEVTFLYNNPGTTITITTTNAPYPVDVSLKLEIIRIQDPASGDFYVAFPSFVSVNPPPTTTNRLQSPNNYFNTFSAPSAGSTSSAILSSLGQLISECTNGLWQLAINQGSSTQQVYSFQVSVSGLDTNLLRIVKIFSPTNGATGIATNPPFFWTGASNYSSLTVDLTNVVSTGLAVTATNWPAAPILSYGTNRFEVEYTSNAFAGVTFTTPVDAALAPIRTWTTVVNLKSSAQSVFVVGAPAPLPVQLINSQNSGGNVRFSFQTLAGRPHTIQSRTNLVLGSWLDVSNFTGDGSLRQFSFPATNPPVKFFRVRTQ